VNPRAIENLVRKRPFAPFQIVVSSGDRYVVDHPENCVLLKEGVFIAFATSPKERLPDDFAMLSYLHIAAAEAVNGKKHKTK
jgi:hypothetical protein